MIVGDDARFIYLMRYYTKVSGYPVLVVPLDEVVTSAEQVKPAVIVLESDLVVSASRDMLQALKADQATCGIPIIVCSWQDAEMNMLAQEADCYLQKPVAYEEFLSALNMMTHI